MAGRARDSRYEAMQFRSRGVRRNHVTNSRNYRCTRAKLATVTYEPRSLGWGDTGQYARTYTYYSTSRGLI